MRENYFVGALLPELRLEAPPEMKFDELMTLLELNLSFDDLKKVAVLRRIFDIYHMRAFLKGKPLSEKGNLDENELEEALLTGEGLPDYFSEKQPFGELLSRYFKEEMAISTGFLKALLKMERDSRLIFAALRAKKLKRDIIKELQYEEADDDLIALILAQKDAPSFDPPEEYAALKALYDEHSESPLDLQKALTEWKFNTISEMEGTDPFSMDAILGYTARLFLVEKELDETKGNQIVDAILMRAK